MGTRRKAVTDKVLRGAAHVVAGMAVPVALVLRKVRRRPAHEEPARAEGQANPRQGVSPPPAKPPRSPVMARKAAKAAIARKKALRPGRRG